MDFLKRTLCCLFFANMVFAFDCSVTLAQQISAIKLDMPGNEDIAELLDGYGLDVVIEFKDRQNVTLESGVFEATVSNGRIKGTYNLNEWPDAAADICLWFGRDDIAAAFAIFQRCKQVNVSAIKRNSYRDNRSLVATQEVFSQERNRLEGLLSECQGSDDFLIRMDREVEDLFETAQTSDLNLSTARLIGKLLDCSSKVGNRIPSDYIFRIAPDGSSALAKKVAAMAAQDLPKDGSADFAAREIFSALVKIDLVQYSRGRPEFLSGYFSTLRFLAEQRHKIAITKGYSGATIAKEFAIFCKDMSGEELKRLCADEFERASWIIVDRTPRRAAGKLSQDIQIALRYHSETAYLLSLNNQSGVLQRFFGKY